ncbi:MAG: hypothetical protein JSS20_02295 [Proteobacteria bacterium]|nr:hypothetical protein [Pseudomonadota bacterium]
MSGVAYFVLETLFALLVLGSFALAFIAVFWLPGRLFDFKHPEYACVFVPAVTICVWLTMSQLQVVVPGIIVISPHKMLAGVALISALAWTWIEEYWWGR